MWCSMISKVWVPMDEVYDRAVFLVKINIAVSNAFLYNHGSTHYNYMF